MYEREVFKKKSIFQTPTHRHDMYMNMTFNGLILVGKQIIKKKIHIEITCDLNFLAGNITVLLNSIFSD